MATAVRNETTNVSEKEAVFSSEKFTQELSNWFEEVKKANDVAYVVIRAQYGKKFVPVLQRYTVAKDGKSEEKLRVNDRGQDNFAEYFELAKIAQGKKVQVKELTIADFNSTISSKMQGFFKNAKIMAWQVDAFAFDGKSNFLSQKEWSQRPKTN